MHQQKAFKHFSASRKEIEQSSRRFISKSNMGGSTLALVGHSSYVHLHRRTIESIVPVVEYLILFVEKVARLTPWEHVSHIFCRAPDGAIRKMMYYKAIRHVEEGTAHFYVMHQERQVELELAHDASGNECLRATIDGQKVDVLLSLPDYRNGGD